MAMPLIWPDLIVLDAVVKLTKQASYSMGRDFSQVSFSTAHLSLWRLDCSVGADAVSVESPPNL